MSVLAIIAFIKAIPSLVQLFSQFQHGPLLMVIMTQSIIIMLMALNTKKPES